MRTLPLPVPARPRLLASLVTAAVVAAILVGAPVGTTDAGATDPGDYSDPEWWPLRGTNLLGCAYNGSGPTCNGHHGVWAIDIEGPEGQEVYAAGAGQAFVHSDSTGCSGFGKAVEIDHDGRWSVYAHLSSIDVTDGQWVDENTVIGRLGHTGSVSGCSYDHLHYEEGPDNTWWTGSLDPGPMKACVDGQLVTYPDAWGRSSWDGLEGHEHLGTSDGTSCASEDLTPELLANGGFESGMTGWTEASGGDSRTTRIGLPFEGAQSLRVDGNGSWSRVHQTVTGGGAAGETFMAEVMVRAVSGTQRARVIVLGLGRGAERARATVTVGTDWQVVRVPITLARDRRRLRVVLLAPAGNRVLFDAASLHRSLVTNGGFESGLAGWTEVSGSESERTARVRLRYEGARSLRVDGNGSWSRVHQRVPGGGRAGDTFVAEVMVRAVNGTRRGRLSILGVGGGVERTNTTFTVGTDWQLVRVPITLAQDRRALRIELLAPAGSRLLFDAASIS